MAKIHPTAIIDPSAKLADDVVVGPYVVVEGDVQIGPGCVLKSHAMIRRYVSMGSGNLVDSHAVLGGEPQDLKFDPNTVSYLKIGDNNIFREGVTISRATGEGKATVVGSRCYWMTGAHAGHNAIVEDDCILVNRAALAGHAEIGRRSILSAHVAVHQFCWIGESVMTQGNSGIGMHVPPFVTVANISQVVGLNVIGLRRTPDITAEDRRQIREAFDITYRSNLLTTRALEKMDQCGDWGPVASKFREFVRKVVTAQKPYNRGLCPLRWRGKQVEE